MGGGYMTLLGTIDQLSLNPGCSANCLGRKEFLVKDRRVPEL